MRGWLAVVVLAALAVVPSAVGTSSAATAGVPWPSERVAVWNDTVYRGAVQNAISAWNGVGTRISLVPARTRAAARIVVSYLDEPGFAGEIGEGTVGWTPGRVAHVRIARGLRPRLAALVATHELGHVLGLDHRTGCSVMVDTLEVGSEADGCGLARCAQLARCLVTPADAATVRDLYERMLPDLRPQAVTDVTAATTRTHLILRWRSPTSGRGAAVLVRLGRSCPGSPYSSPLKATSLIPLQRGERQELRVPLTGAGHWCAGLWVQDSATYLTSLPTTVRLTIR